MINRKNSTFLVGLLLLMPTVALCATETLDSLCCRVAAPHDSRLQIGGYGEAVTSRMFYSNNWKRYTDASKYKNDPSHGECDIPHAVIMLNYDFGHGWTMGSEIEFEHGGTESATEIEEEETGEYEKDVERGGEGALEQFWIQKSFSPIF